MTDLAHIDVDNLRIVYRSAGEGEPLVFLHGYTYSSYCFRHNISILSKMARIVCPDLPGHGKSSKPVMFDYSLFNQAKVVNDFCRALGLEKITLGGCSMGGALAMTTAIHYPELVDRLILVDSAGVDVDVKSPQAVFSIPIVGHFVASIVASRFARSTRVRMTNGVGDDVSQELKEYLTETRRLSTWVCAIRNLMANKAFKVPAINRIKQKTLIVWGENDPLFSIRSGRILASQIADSRMIVLPDVGHLPNEERPADFNQVVVDFLQDRIPKL